MFTISNNCCSVSASAYDNIVVTGKVIVAKTFKRKGESENIEQMVIVLVSMTTVVTRRKAGY